MASPLPKGTPGRHLMRFVGTLDDTSTREMMAAIEEGRGSYEESLREVAFRRMMERGWADSKAGRTISDEAMKRKIDTWVAEMKKGDG